MSDQVNRESRAISARLEGQLNRGAGQRWLSWAWRKRRKMTFSFDATGDPTQSEPRKFHLSYYFQLNQEHPSDPNSTPHFLACSKSSAIDVVDEANSSAEPINSQPLISFKRLFHHQNSKEQAEAAQLASAATGPDSKLADRSQIEMISYRASAEIAAAAINWPMQNDSRPQRKLRSKSNGAKQNKPLFTSLVYHYSLIIYLALLVPSCAMQLDGPSALELGPPHLLASPYGDEGSRAPGRSDTVEPAEHDLLVQLIQSTGSLQEANQLLERLILGDPSAQDADSTNTPSSDYTQVRPNLGRLRETAPEVTHGPAGSNVSAPIRMFLPGQLADQTELTLVNYSSSTAESGQQPRQHKLLDEIIQASARDQSSQANVNVHYDDDLHQQPTRPTTVPQQAFDQDRPAKVQRDFKQNEKAPLAPSQLAPTTVQASAATSTPNPELHQAASDRHTEDPDGLYNNESISSLIIRAAQPSRQLIANYSHWINHEAGQVKQPALKAARLPVTLLPYLPPPPAAVSSAAAAAELVPASPEGHAQSHGIKFMEAPSLTTTTSTTTSTTSGPLPAADRHSQPGESEASRLQLAAHGRATDNGATRVAIRNSTSASGAIPREFEKAPSQVGSRAAQLDEFLPVSSHHEPRRVWRTTPLAKGDELEPSEPLRNSSSAHSVNGVNKAVFQKKETRVGAQPRAAAVPTTLRPAEVSSFLSPEASVADPVSVATSVSTPAAAPRRTGSKKANKARLKKTSARKKVKSVAANNSTQVLGEQLSVNVTQSEQAAAARLAKSMNLAHLFLGTSRVSDRMPATSAARLANWTAVQVPSLLTTSGDKPLTELPIVLDAEMSLAGDMMAPTPDSLLSTELVGKDGRQHWRAVELPLRTHTPSPPRAAKTAIVQQVSSEPSTKTRTKSAPRGVARHTQPLEATRQLLANRSASGWDLDRLSMPDEQPAWRPASLVSAVRRSTVTTSTSTSSWLAPTENALTSEEPTDYSLPQTGAPDHTGVQFDDQQLVGSTTSETMATTQQSPLPTTPARATADQKYDADPPLPSANLASPNQDLAKVSSNPKIWGEEELRVGARPSTQVINQPTDGAHLPQIEQNDFSAYRQLAGHNRSPANRARLANHTSNYYGRRRPVDQVSLATNSGYLDIGEQAARVQPTRRPMGAQRASSPSVDKPVQQTKTPSSGGRGLSLSDQPAGSLSSEPVTATGAGAPINSRQSPSHLTHLGSSTTPSLMADETWLSTTTWPTSQDYTNSEPNRDPSLLDERAQMTSYMAGSSTTNRPILRELIYKDPENSSPVRRASSSTSSTTPSPSTGTPPFVPDVAKATTESPKADWQMSTLPLHGSDPLPSILFHNRLSSLFQYKLANRSSSHADNEPSPAKAFYPFDYQTKEPTSASRKPEFNFTGTNSPSQQPVVVSSGARPASSLSLTSNGSSASQPTNKSLLKLLQVNADKQRMKGNSSQPGVSGEPGEDMARKRRASLFSLAAHYAAAYKVRTSQGKPSESGDAQQVPALDDEPPGASDRPASSMSPLSAHNTSLATGRFRRRDKHKATLIKNQSDNNRTQIDSPSAQLTEQTGGELESAVDKFQKLPTSHANAGVNSQRVLDEDLTGVSGNKSSDPNNNELSKQPLLHLYQSLSANGKRRFSRPSTASVASTSTPAPPTSTSSTPAESELSSPSAQPSEPAEEDKDDSYAASKGNLATQRPAGRSVEAKLAALNGSKSASDLAGSAQTQADSGGRWSTAESGSHNTDQAERVERRERRPNPAGEPRKRRREPPGTEPGPAEPADSAWPAATEQSSHESPTGAANMMNNLFARLPQANSSELAVKRDLTSVGEYRPASQDASSPSGPPSNSQRASLASSPFLLNDYRTKSLVRTMINLGVPNSNSSATSAGLGDQLRQPSARIRMIRLERPNALTSNQIPAARSSSQAAETTRLRQFSLKPTLFPRLRYPSTLVQALPGESAKPMDEPSTSVRPAQASGTPTSGSQALAPSSHDQLSLSTPSAGYTTPLSRLILATDEPNADTSNSVYLQQQAAASGSTLSPVAPSTLHAPIWSFSASSFGLPAGSLSDSIYTSQPAWASTSPPTLATEVSSYKPPLMQDWPLFGQPFARPANWNQRNQRQQPSVASGAGEQAVQGKQPGAGSTASNSSSTESSGSSATPSSSSASYHLSAFQRAAVFTVALCCTFIVLALLLVAIAIKCRRSLKAESSEHNLTSPKADLGRQLELEREQQQRLQRRKRANGPLGAQRKRSSQATYLPTLAQLRPAARSAKSKFPPKSDFLLAPENQLGSSASSSPADSTATSMCLSSSSEALNYLSASQLHDKSSQHLLKGPRRAQQLVSALARPARSSKPPKGRPVELASYAQQQQSSSYSATMREIGGSITSRLLRMHLPRLLPYFAFDYSNQPASDQNQLNLVEPGKQQAPFAQLAPHNRDGSRPVRANAHETANSAKLSMSDLLNLASRRTKKAPEPAAHNFQLRSSATDKLVPNYSADKQHQRGQRPHNSACRCPGCVQAKREQLGAAKATTRTKLPFGTASSVLRQPDLGERRQAVERLSYLAATSERSHQADTLSIQYSQMDNEHHLLIDNQPGPSKLPLKGSRLMAGYEQHNYSSHHQLPRLQQRPASIIYDENDENEPTFAGARLTPLSRPLPAANPSSKPATQRLLLSNSNNSILGTHFSKRFDSTSMDPHSGSATTRAQLADRDLFASGQQQDHEDQDDLSSLSDNYYNLEHNYDGHPTYQVSKEPGGSGLERTRPSQAMFQAGSAANPASSTKHQDQEQEASAKNNKQRLTNTNSNCHCNLVLYPL